MNKEKPRSSQIARNGLAQIADQLNEFAELGVSHMNTFLSPNNERGYETLALVLELLDKA